jgi:hypothetical protein
MGEVQDGVGKNGKGEDETQGGASKKDKPIVGNEVARGVIQRLRRGEPNNDCQREAAAPDFDDEELDVPNLEVPEDQ